MCDHPLRKNDFLRFILDIFNIFDNMTLGSVRQTSSYSFRTFKFTLILEYKSLLFECTTSTFLISSGVPQKKNYFYPSFHHSFRLIPYIVTVFSYQKSSSNPPPLSVIVVSLCPKTLMRILGSSLNY